MKPLPEEFLKRARLFTGDEYTDFIDSLSEPPSISIRINPFKRSDNFSNAEKISWSSEGRYLDERPSFTSDPFFHAGCYYVQDASSQFLEQPFLQAKKYFKRPLRILDLCAAPGGKSTHMLSMIDIDDLLVCNEVVPSRNNILRQNIMKWGMSNVVVTQNDPSEFSRLHNFFDVVVVDAPCSGEGLFRKDEDAREEWSPENVHRCTIRQQEILKHAVSTLNPGGFLIYSTCTFEEDENDNQVNFLCRDLDMESVLIENNFQGITKTKNGLLFYPHKIRGEGFYISLLQKKAGDIQIYKKTTDRNDISLMKLLSAYLKNSNDYFPLKKDERLFAIPVVHLNSFNILSKNLYLRLGGIYLGDFKGSDFIPSAALALSNSLRDDIPNTDVSMEQAHEFLKGGSPQTSISKGWSVVSFNNFKLGWIKNIGSRSNNYYPKEWRIRKSSK